MNIIIGFYVFSLFYIGSVGIFALLKKKKELVNRSITLMAALHVLCLVFLGGTYVFLVFAAALLCAGAYEMTRRTRAGSFWGIAMALGFGVFLFLNKAWLDDMLPVFLLTSLFAFAGKKEHVRSGCYLYGFVLLVLVPCVVSIAAIYEINSGWMISLILLLQLNDGFAYLAGKGFGKTKLFKRISPNKSLEGYAAGMLGIILGLVLLHSAIPMLKGYPIGRTALLAAYMFIFGNAGDLLFSAVKRKLDIKDFSNILPGHGGILDRFDNILFAGPVLYFILQAW